MLNGIKQKLKNYRLRDTFDFYSISFGIRNVSDINLALKEAYPSFKTRWQIYVFRIFKNR